MALFGRKSARQFHCNDALWNTYRRMAEDQEKQVDDLINDALEAYAQLAGYQTGIDAAQSDGADDAPATPPPAPPPAHARTTLPLSQSHPPPLPPPPPAMFQSGPATSPAPSPSYASATDGTPGVPAPPLYLVFDNQKYRIDKDQFIIGRGAKSSDLPIKDGNISRKHAAVIRRNGTYFIKDLGSTNGIDYKGMRIDNKRIDEGDVFHLCDYELRFTYRR
jgi:hypothetical protein